MMCTMVDDCDCAIADASLATPQKRSKLTEMRWMNGKTGYLASWLAGYIAGLAGLVDTQSSSSGLHLKID